MLGKELHKLVFLVVLYLIPASLREKLPGTLHFASLFSLGAPAGAQVHLLHSMSSARYNPIT